MKSLIIALPLLLLLLSSSVIAKEKSKDSKSSKSSSKPAEKKVKETKEEDYDPEATKFNGDSDVVLNADINKLDDIMS